MMPQIIPSEQPIGTNPKITLCLCNYTGTSQSCSSWAGTKALVVCHITNNKYKCSTIYLVQSGLGLWMNCSISVSLEKELILIYSPMKASVEPNNRVNGRSESTEEHQLQYK